MATSHLINANPFFVIPASVANVARRGAGGDLLHSIVQRYLVSAGPPGQELRQFHCGRHDGNSIYAIGSTNFRESKSLPRGIGKHQFLLQKFRRAISRQENNTEYYLARFLH